MKKTSTKRKHTDEYGDFNLPPKGFQGKEITATLQAPTMKALDKMLKELNEYAINEQMEEIEVLQKGKDPDGGYRAVVVAHNWNPFTWIKEKFEGRGGGPVERAKTTRLQQEAAMAEKRAIIRGKTKARQRILEVQAEEAELARAGMLKNA